LGDAVAVVTATVAAVTAVVTATVAATVAAVTPATMPAHGSARHALDASDGSCDENGAVPGVQAVCVCEAIRLTWFFRQRYPGAPWRG